VSTTAISMNSDYGWGSTLGDCVQLEGTCKRLTNVVWSEHIHSQSVGELVGKQFGIGLNLVRNKLALAESATPTRLNPNTS
jgi:hypothetical protein